jgi:hypothetical protein
MSRQANRAVRSDQRPQRDPRTAASATATVAAALAVIIDPADRLGKPGPWIDATQFGGLD